VCCGEAAPATLASKVSVALALLLALVLSLALAGEAGPEKRREAEKAEIADV